MEVSPKTAELYDKISNYWDKFRELDRARVSLLLAWHHCSEDERAIAYEYHGVKIIEPSELFYLDSAQLLESIQYYGLGNVNQYHELPNS